MALIFGLAGCSIGPSSVARMSDGVVHEGRFIAPEAYAEYARGAWLEQRGDRVGALAHYTLALEADEGAPEILARIGSVRCGLSKAHDDTHAQEAREAFARALESDPASSVALAESARCHARFRRHAAALTAALGAARADPESIPLQLLVVELAEAAGALDLARNFLDALVARSPESRLAWLHVAAFAERHDDAGRALRARRALGTQGTPATDRALALALDRGDLKAARAHAAALRIGPGELAARAALRGATALAREQAELVLAADPTDPDAWITLLSAQDLARDKSASESTLAHAPFEPAALPSASGRRLHAELLERVVGPEARRAWEAAF